MADDTTTPKPVTVVKAASKSDTPTPVVTPEAATATVTADDTPVIVNGNTVITFKRTDKVKITNKTVGGRSFNILDNGVVKLYQLAPGASFTGYVAQPDNPLFKLWQELGAVVIVKV